MAGGPDHPGVGAFTQDHLLMLQTASVNAPQHTADAGYPGQIAFDASNLYVCVAPNQWRMIALANLPTILAAPVERELPPPAEPAPPPPPVEHLKREPIFGKRR